jgi:hypothetical protein
MKNNTLFITLCFSTFFILNPKHSYAIEVELEYKNKIYEEAIHTVLLQQNGSEERLPLIKLNQTNGLLLRFDELRPDNDYYQYRYIHCNAQWEPSPLQPFDYIEGELFGSIDEFEFSQNTYFQYTHYNLIFPNNRMMPKLSGNYLLVVYRNFDEADIILSQRFMVIDDVFTIEGYIERASNVAFRFQKHEVDFTVITDNYEIPNPMLDIQAVILQNINWNTAIYGLKPRFVNRGVLNYNYDVENNFWAGNEFRFFDIRSLRTMSPGVQKKFFDEQNKPVAKLFTEKTRLGQPYLQYIDYNGKMVLDNRDGASRNPNISSDYVKVEFSFLNPGGEYKKPVYIYGELTNWELNDDFRMLYDPETNRYYADLILKQGYYSYWYVLPDDKDESQPDLSLTEGNHFQTENDYHVLIYHRNQFLRYDELLGVNRFSSAGDQKRD